MDDPSNRSPPSGQLIRVGDGSGHLPEGQQSLTVSDALAAFVQTLPNKNNYVPVVRKYLAAAGLAADKLSSHSLRHTAPSCLSIRG